MNKKYGILDEPELSMEILSMQKYTNALWLLTDCVVSRKTIAKLIKGEYGSENVLPILTVVANFIENCTVEDANSLFENQEVQNLIEKGLKDSNYEISR